MIGRLLGKTVGTVLAAPAILAKEAQDAINETAKTVDRAYDALDGKGKGK